MTCLSRDLNTASTERFDLVVVGGGIYGACVLLEASRRGWKTLLIERSDFGGATSWNSLRIIHGGLRYLQNADLSRFRQSVREQAWWLANFSDLVEPLPCLMPLYNQGLRRTSVLRCALTLSDLLAQPIRRAVCAQHILPRSGVISTEAARALFPDVRAKGLAGGAIWHDARITSPQRLLIELLRWATAAGGRTLNYVQCTGFEQRNSRISAVKARCGVTGEELRFQTDYVVNCAGPWCQEIAAATGASVAPHPADHAVAFNLVLNRAPLSGHAIAISADAFKATTYFVVPYRGRTMVGTGHIPPQAASTPSNCQISAVFADLNRAIPGWQLEPSDVMQILAGRMPPQTKGSHVPAKSPTIVHHGLSSGAGIQNMTSVAGPKYTTARHVAQVALEQIAKRRGADYLDYSSVSRPCVVPVPDVTQADGSWVARELQSWINRESVLHVDDLVLRRCDLEPDQQLAMGSWLAQSHRWPTSAQDQIQRLQNATDRGENTTSLP